jgi:hypothetical protein
MLIFILFSQNHPHIGASHSTNIATTKFGVPSNCNCMIKNAWTEHCALYQAENL